MNFLERKLWKSLNFLYYKLGKKEKIQEYADILNEIIRNPLVSAKKKESKIIKRFIGEKIFLVYGNVRFLWALNF